MTNSRLVGARGRIIPRNQDGVVLFIALIILVAMTMAGLGMMRSVDTGNLIAGNLAFRQATEHANDVGSNFAFGVLSRVANSVNSQDQQMLYVDGDGTQPCPVGAPTCAGTVNIPGYFSSPIDPCEVRRDCVGGEYSWWANAANWAGAPAIDVHTDPADLSSNTIATANYLIHRMCVVANAAPTKNACLWKEEDNCDPTNPCNNYVLYRITVRAVGLRNSTTYTQTLVLNPEPM